jgi:hypothetical protein
MSYPAYSMAQGTGSIDTNSPNLPPSGKLHKGGEPPQRAITDAVQCANIVRRLENDNRDRNLKAARIQSKYDAERPYGNQQLKADGLGWKSNFSSQPMPVLVDKVAPRFQRAVAAAKYLTSSKLPENVPGAAKKTEAYRREFTKLCRSRPGWHDLIGEISQENTLFGYTGCGWLDEQEWFPTHYRGDRFLIPQGTKQHAKLAQVVCFVEHYQPHELFEQIRDHDAAVDAGWDVPKTTQAINNALPTTVRVAGQEYSRFFVDLQRESNVSNSMSSGAKEIIVYNVLVYEVTGKVSHWKVAYPNMDVLFRQDDRFEAMSDAACFFSFQQATGTMHSSKGIGRIVYAMAGILDRARNEVVDRLQLAGKVLVQAEDKQLRRFKMSVFGNAVLIGQPYQVQTQQIFKPYVDEFLALDSFMRSLLDELSGNVSPKQLKGERVTNDQVNLFAQREEESKDNNLGRFLLQFSNMATTMQKRAFSPDVDDPDAKAARERLLKIMSQEELDILRNQPSATVVRDLSDQERNNVAVFATEQAGNPLFDQRELARRKTSAIFSDEFADSVLLPVNDPTVTAEQSRSQTMENMILATGQDVPVSPRDNHLIHIQTMEPVIQQLVDALQTNTEASQPLLQVLAHAKEHVQQGLASGEDQAEFSAMADKIVLIEDRMKQVQQFELLVQEAVQQGATPEQAVAFAQQKLAEVQAAGAPPPPAPNA